MTEADFSGKVLGVSGIIMLVAWIQHKDRGAMTSLDLSSNYLGSVGGKHVAETIKVDLIKCMLAVDSTSRSTAIIRRIWKR
jgi:hypothetical protein